MSFNKLFDDLDLTDRRYFFELVFTSLEHAEERIQDRLKIFHPLSLVCSRWKYHVDDYLPPHFLRRLVYSPFDETVFDLGDFLAHHRGLWYARTFPQSDLLLSWLELRQYESWREWRHEYVVVGFAWHQTPFALQIDHGWDAPAGWQQYVPIGGSMRGKQGGNEATLVRGAEALPGRDIAGVRTVCHVEAAARKEPLGAFLDEVAFLLSRTPRYSLTGINCWAWSRYLLFWAVWETLYAREIVVDGRAVSRDVFLREHASNAWSLRVQFGRPHPNFLSIFIQSVAASLYLVLPYYWASQTLKWYTRFCVWDTVKLLKVRYPSRGRNDTLGLRVSSAGVHLPVGEYTTDTFMAVDGFPHRLASVDLAWQDAIESMVAERFVSDWDGDGGATVMPGCEPDLERPARFEADIHLYRQLSSPGNLCYLVCPLLQKPRMLLIEIVSEAHHAAAASTAAGPEDVIFANLGLIRETFFGGRVDVVASSRVLTTVPRRDSHAVFHKVKLEDNICLEKARRGDKLCLWIGASGAAVHIVSAALISPS